MSTLTFAVLFLSALPLPTLLGQPGKPSGTPDVLDPSKFREHTVWIPYWSEKDGHHAILHIRNALHHLPLTATVQIFSQQGAALATRTLSLPKLANADLPLQPVIPSSLAEADRAGSIRISYSYPYEGVLQAELSIRDDRRNHSYTIVGRRAYTGTSKFAYLAIHRPTKDTYLEMALMNPTSTATTVRLSIRNGLSWKEIGTMSLNPLETEKLRVPAETLTAAFSVSAPDTALIRAEYSH